MSANEGMGNRPAIERITLIVGHLKHGHKVNASIMAKEFEVTTKTIHRDLEFMRDRLQIPIVYDAENFTFKLTTAYTLPWFAL